jgi:hypothetical protein
MRAGAPSGTRGKSCNGRRDHPFACAATGNRAVLIGIERLPIETVAPVQYFIQVAK